MSESVYGVKIWPELDILTVVVVLGALARLHYLCDYLAVEGGCPLAQFEFVPPWLKQQLHVVFLAQLLELVQLLPAWRLLVNEDLHSN